MRYFAVMLINNLIRGVGRGAKKEKKKSLFYFCDYIYKKISVLMKYAIENIIIFTPVVLINVETTVLSGYFNY